MTKLLFSLSVCGAIFFSWLIADGQAIRRQNEDEHPVKRYSGRAQDIALSEFEFQLPYLGYEGPSLAPIETEPTSARTYLVTTELYGQESISTAKFELIDVHGVMLELVHMVKSDNALDRGHFIGAVRVPTKPFRVLVTGLDVKGSAFRRVYKHVFRPVNQSPTPFPLPPELTPSERTQAAAALATFQQQIIEKIEANSSKQQDGMIVMPRVGVAHVTYQPLLSEKGSVLGMRLRYEVRYAANGDYAHSIQVFPSYQEVKYRGLMELEVVKEKIEPAPKPPSSWRNPRWPDKDNLVGYGSWAWFEAGVTYHFTVDLKPDFVRPTPSGPCVYEDSYNPSRFEAWKELMMHQNTPVPYRIFMDKLDYSGETEPFYPPKTLYDSFLNEGVPKCKPQEKY